MAERRRKSHSERWCIIGCIEETQSVKEVVLSVNFSTMETMPNKSNRSRETVPSHPRVTTPSDDRNIVIVAKRNQQGTSSTAIFMVAVILGKTLSASILNLCAEDSI
ncbi:hypothetical protein NPIL_359281 [Nephila pilipes]|uniref:Uncharacterized protein n=1 Tax=Nephila pilipes TaxID=299642 RepID=A0A8X6U4T9_NEPPI|nr:hypothetical protein NPIL_359281 [Nephila pilipes]